jgi:beta-glucanase (GH16 family)
MKLTFYFLLLLTVSQIACTTPRTIVAASDPNKWELVWHDEFDGTGLPNAADWDYEKGFVRNNELQYYTVARTENVRQEGGSLLIESRKESFPNAAYQAGSDNWMKKDQLAQYTSGSLITRGRHEFFYGRMEVRAKLSQGLGSWPAIWMVGTNTTKWPDKGEIDIMEHVGFDPLVIHATMHALTSDPNATKPDNSKGMTIRSTEDVFDTFHVYAIEWYEDHIDCFFDGTKYFTYVFKDYSIQAGIFNKPYYLLINNAVGGSWGGQKGIDESSFPQKYYIDYVRYFKRK